MIELRNGGLNVTLCEPWTYYQGRRFDHGGVFRSIVKDGFSFADEWFKEYDPLKHDAVCGCSEEYVFKEPPVLKPGQTFVKPGVGVLVQPDDEEPYAFVRPYKVADRGMWDYRTENGTKAVFHHVLEGWYDYTKTVELISGDSLRIVHHILWKNPQPFNGWCYCHNFYTFGGKPVGPGRCIDFSFTPAGDWRDKYHCVALTDNGIRFSGPVEPPSVYMCNLHPVEGLQNGPFVLKIRDCGHTVTIHSEFEKIIFWSNNDVSCLEPYKPLFLEKGSVADWSSVYSFE